MIELTGYIPPKSGERYTTKRVWINPRAIVSMSEYDAVAEREPDGKYTRENVKLISISFAAAYAEEQVGISVTNSADDILRAIHFWSIENIPGYKELHA